MTLLEEKYYKFFTENIQEHIKDGALMPVLELHQKFFANTTEWAQLETKSDLKADFLAIDWVGKFAPKERMNRIANWWLSRIKK